jgi:hypothetical protein
MNIEEKYNRCKDKVTNVCAEVGSRVEVKCLIDIHFRSSPKAEVVGKKPVPASSAPFKFVRT